MAIISILLLIEWIPSVKIVWISSFCIKYNCFVLLKANSEHPLLFVWEDHYFLLLNFSRPILSSKCLSLIVIWQLQKKILIYVLFIILWPLCNFPILASNLSDPRHFHQHHLRFLHYYQKNDMSTICNMLTFVCLLLTKPIFFCRLVNEKV